MLHNHIFFTHYCQCITLATDNIFKQYSQMHAHMVHSPTQHTHTHTHTQTQLHSTVATFTGTRHTDITKLTGAFLYPFIFNTLQSIISNFLMSVQVMLSVMYSTTHIFQDDVNSLLCASRCNNKSRNRVNRSTTIYFLLLISL